MLRNAFAYITRKWPKSLLLFAIILLMGDLELDRTLYEGSDPTSFIGKPGIHHQ